jgi:hypothetical protein
MVEHRLTSLHGFEAAFDDRTIDPAFVALPAEEIDDPFNRRLPIVQ